MILDQKRYPEAEQLLGKVCEVGDLLFPSGHHELALAKRNLGDCLRQLGDYEESEGILLDALDVLEEEVGPTHPSTRAALKSLIDLYTAWEKPGLAAEYRERL